MNEQHLQQGKSIIDHAFSNTLNLALFKSDKTTNVLNKIGERMGYEKMSLDEPELYMALSQYVTTKLKDKMNTKPIHEAKDILKETSFEIAQSKNILRYEEDDVVKTIKDIIKKEFSNVTLEHIKGDEGGAFYTMVVSLGLEEDIRNDLERKRFYIMQAMQQFKARFFGSMSAILPVINMNTGSYEFTKNSTKLRFSATLCLSHTNDRDWVSGVYKGPEAKKKEAKEIKEASASHRHALKSMSLNSAIQSFQNQRMDRKMLETAIKACGRNELEFYVLRAIGLGVEVDLSDIEPDSTADTDAAKSSKPGRSQEKPYDPNQKLSEV